MAKSKTKEQISYNMSKVKNKDTSIELLLRKALWARGFRYRKNYKELPGKPDIVITKHKIAIFCDSEFFHGKDWEELKIQLAKGKNADFWIAKISRNRERDEEINKELTFMGWKVLRFWGKDIKNNLEECIKTVEEAVFDKVIDDEE